MNIRLDSWKAQLVNLPPNERAELAYLLLSSLESEEDRLEVEVAWDREAALRVEAIRAGKVTGFPAEDLIAELRERYP